MNNPSQKHNSRYKINTIIVIIAKPEHLAFMQARCTEAALVNNEVRAVITEYRHDMLKSDTDLTILYELESLFADIPRADWRVDWEQSQLSPSPLERLITKKIMKYLTQEDGNA